MSEPVTAFAAGTFGLPQTEDERDAQSGYRCAMFRNETGSRASDLIRAAVEVTERLWGASPFGWMTYVDATRVRTQIPGYCFRRAGWKRDRAFSHDRLLRFTLGAQAC